VRRYRKHTAISETIITSHRQLYTMPTAVPARKNKGKARAEPEKVTAALPLGKQLAHTGLFNPLLCSYFVLTS
jgi:hypothetical protein